MKQLLNIMVMLLCVVMNSHGMDDDQPPLTDEMISLGLTPFTTRNEQIRTIYLVDDATWKTNLKTAAEQFVVAEQRRKEEGEIKNLIPLYWSLSQTYDYGPANAVLHSACCLGEFDLTKNSDWSMFFSSGRPSTVNAMNLDRLDYLSDKDYYLGENLDHEGSDSSAEETAHNDSFPSKDGTPPKDEYSSAEAATWHFSDLFSWVSRKSTASSRSSNERIPPNASFSSRESTPPKDEGLDVSQPLLGSAVKYGVPAEGLRRRNVGGAQQ